jgi:hypothetical protein
VNDSKKYDVLNTSLLNKFLRKRDGWLTWLKNDEYRAIWPYQITSMIWDDVVFQVLSHAQKSLSESTAANRLLGLSLERGYVATQVLAMRRLWDKGNDVISLRRLRDDVCLNCAFEPESFLLPKMAVPTMRQIQRGNIEYSMICLV